MYWSSFGVENTVPELIEMVLSNISFLVQSALEQLSENSEIQHRHQTSNYLNSANAIKIKPVTMNADRLSRIIICNNKVFW